MFKGTFKKTTLEKILKFGKLPSEIIQRIMMTVVEEPTDPGEVSICHVILALAKPTLLETRLPYRVTNEDGKVIALGLANGATDAEKLLEGQINWKKCLLCEIGAAKFNEYRVSTDCPSFITFGL
jgi:hypothetical protein